MRRREFIAGLGAVATALPVAARAQQRGRMRRIGVLTNLPIDDAQMQARNGAFLESLQKLGWTPRNVEIEYRWGAEFADRNREYAAELVALAPDVIVDMGGSPGLAALQRATRTVPIVFANIVDPVGQGFVEGLARPGGNITGFTIFEYGLSVCRACWRWEWRGMPPPLSETGSGEQSSRWRHHSGLSCVQSTCMSRAPSSVRCRRSRAGRRMAD